MTVRRTEAADSSISDQSSLMQLPSQGVGERLTDDSVAHGHRPPDPSFEPHRADDAGNDDFDSQMQPASSTAHPLPVGRSSSAGPLLHATPGYLVLMLCGFTDVLEPQLLCGFLMEFQSLTIQTIVLTTLTGDPTTWPLQLRSVWNDYFQVDDVISFTMVESLPGGLQEAAHLGFIFIEIWNQHSELCSLRCMTMDLVMGPLFHLLEFYPVTSR